MVGVGDLPLVQDELLPRVLLLHLRTHVLEEKLGLPLVGGGQDGLGSDFVPRVLAQTLVDSLHFVVEEPVRIRLLVRLVLSIFT